MKPSLPLVVALAVAVLLGVGLVYVDLQLGGAARDINGLRNQNASLEAQVNALQGTVNDLAKRAKLADAALGTGGTLQTLAANIASGTLDLSLKSLKIVSGESRLSSLDPTRTRGGWWRSPPLTAPATPRSPRPPEARGSGSRPTRERAPPTPCSWRHSETTASTFRRGRPTPRTRGRRGPGCTSWTQGLTSSSHRAGRGTPKAAYRLTKIVFTLGPATEDEAMLERLILAGVDVCRLNMAHADEAWTRTMIRRVREVCRRTQRHIALLMDVKGPEIRTGDLPAPVDLAAGQLIDLLPKPGAAEDGVLAVGVNYPRMGGDVSVGNDRPGRQRPHPARGAEHVARAGALPGRRAGAAHQPPPHQPARRQGAAAGPHRQGPRRHRGRGGGEGRLFRPVVRARGGRRRHPEAPALRPEEPRADRRQDRGPVGDRQPGRDHRRGRRRHGRARRPRHRGADGGPAPDPEANGRRLHPAPQAGHRRDAPARIHDHLARAHPGRGERHRRRGVVHGRRHHALGRDDHRPSTRSSACSS
jgi:hypothetical protein